MLFKLKNPIWYTNSDGSICKADIEPAMLFGVMKSFKKINLMDLTSFHMFLEINRLLPVIVGIFVSAYRKLEILKKHNGWHGHSPSKNRIVAIMPEDQ